MWFVSIIVGVLSVLLGVYLLKREIKDAIRAIPREQNPQEIRRELDELGSSFFDIANDLEGKYSVHEKQLQDIEYVLKEYQKNNVETIKKGVIKSIPQKNSLSLSQQNGAPKRERKDSTKIYTKGDSEKIIHEQQIELEVRRLMDEGYSISEIAKKLGMGVAEIRLILGMRGFRDELI